MMMPGMDSTHLMPGMLTAEQLAQLDRAQGEDFDALFLRLMIQHHEGPSRWSIDFLPPAPAKRTPCTRWRAAFSRSDDRNRADAADARR